MSNTLKQRAAVLKSRADALQDAGMMQRMNEAPALVEDVAAFLVDLADRVDALTPYIDEGAET